MENNKPKPLNGKERRSGADRRKSERRTPERENESGVLSERKGERRRQNRRTTDIKTAGKKSET
jgi:hypothetical protein